MLRIKLSAHKYKALSQATTDIAQVLFASAVITPILAGINLDNWYIILTGAISSVIIWGISLYFAEKGKL